MKLARVNTSLLVLIVLVNGCSALLPFAPQLLFGVQNHSARATQLEQKVKQSSGGTVQEQNRLIVPSMLLDQPLFEGQTARTLRQGLWRRPGTGTPERGGNTVVAGHRFTYTNPRGTFYHLDKVRLGDDVGVLWHGRMYRYVVREIKVVQPADNTVEASTPEPRLTLYTCTPLWWPKDRLVVIATPYEGPNKTLTLPPLQSDGQASPPRLPQEKL